MNLLKAKDVIMKLLFSKNEVFTNEETEMLQAGFNILSFHIYMSEKNRAIERDGIELVKDCIRLLSRKILDDALTNDLCIFSSAFSDLVYNWNDNLFKDEDIKIMCLYIFNVIDLRNVVRENILTMKSIYNHYRDLSSWMPPAFDLNKPYLEQLLSKDGKEETEVILQQVAA